MVHILNYYHIPKEKNLKILLWDMKKSNKVVNFILLYIRTLIYSKCKYLSLLIIVKEIKGFKLNLLIKVSLYF